MVRFLVSLLALVGLMAAAPARDWREVARENAAGAYVIGNPAAPVKLIEYLSYTCPHCAHFSAESRASLRDGWVRSGQVSVELRHAARDPLDLAAAIIARCAGPRGFAAMTDAIYAAQPDWLERGINYQGVNAARLQLYPVLAQLRAYADGSGLSDLARAHGVTGPALDACFASQAELDRIVAMGADAGRTITGTPSFTVNGKFEGAEAWSSLEPQLRAAGAH